MITKLVPKKVFFTGEVGKPPKKPESFTTSAGCALPVDANKHGYISEYHAYEESSQNTGIRAVKLAESMYSTWTKESPLKTFSIPRSSAVQEIGDRTTVISAAVFII